MEIFISWRGKFLSLLTIALALAAPIHSQQPGEPLTINDPAAPPAHMFDRTVPIRVGQEYGTAFVIDYKGRQYIITAKHLVKNLPRKNATIQVFGESPVDRPKKFESIDASDSTIHVYGNTAVLTTVERTSAQIGGRAISGQARNTYVCVKRDGRWVVVLRQITPVVPPKSETPAGK